MLYSLYGASVPQFFEILLHLRGDRICALVDVKAEEAFLRSQALITACRFLVTG